MWFFFPQHCQWSLLNLDFYVFLGKVLQVPSVKELSMVSRHVLHDIAPLPMGITAMCIVGRSKHPVWQLKHKLGMYLIRVENMQKVMTLRVYYQHETSVWCCYAPISIGWIIDKACAHLSFICTLPVERGLIFWHIMYEDDGYVCGPHSWHSWSADNSWASLCMDLDILPGTDNETWCTEEMFGIHTFACVFRMVNDIHFYLSCALGPCTERFP